MLSKTVISAATFVSSILLADMVHANTCSSWWNPYDQVAYNGGITLTYHGGQQLQGAQIVAILIGQSFTSSGFGQQYASSFVSHLSYMLDDPQFWARYSQYGPNSGSFWGPINLEQTWSNLSLPDDSDIRTAIQQAQNVRELPVQASGGSPYAYLVFLPPDITVPRASPGTGYHDSDTNSSLGITYAYAVVQMNGAAVDDLSGTPAHEVMEMVTDPFKQGSVSNGWWASGPSDHEGGQYEIGDLCNALFRSVPESSTVKVWWQASWLQDQCRCDSARTVGVFTPSSAQWQLSTSSTGTNVAFTFAYGASTDSPVAGDWDGDGVTTIGVFRPGNMPYNSCLSSDMWILRNSNTVDPVLAKILSRQWRSCRSRVSMMKSADAR